MPDVADAEDRLERRRAAAAPARRSGSSHSAHAGSSSGLAGGFVCRYGQARGGPSRAGCRRGTWPRRRPPVLHARAGRSTTARGPSSSGSRCRSSRRGARGAACRSRPCAPNQVARFDRGRTPSGPTTAAMAPPRVARRIWSRTRGVASERASGVSAGTTGAVRQARSLLRM